MPCKMEASSSSEIFLTISITLWRQKPVDHDITSVMLLTLQQYKCICRRWTSALMSCAKWNYLYRCSNRSVSSIFCKSTVRNCPWSQPPAYSCRQHTAVSWRSSGM